MGEDVHIRVSEMSIPPKEPLPSLPPKVLLYAEVKDVTKIRAALQKRNLLGDAPVEVVTVVGGKEQNVPLGLCVDPSKVNELSTIEGVRSDCVLTKGIMQFPFLMVRTPCTLCGPFDMKE